MAHLLARFAAIGLVLTGLAGCVTTENGAGSGKGDQSPSARLRDDKTGTDFDPVTYDMVKMAETLCVEIEPYDEERITKEVNKYLKKPITPKIEEESAVWVIPGPMGRFIILDRDPRPGKYRCKMVFTYGHAKTAFYWLDEYTKKFANAVSGQYIAGKPKRKPEKQATIKGNILLYTGVTLVLAVFAQDDGTLALVITDVDLKKVMKDLET